MITQRGADHTSDTPEMDQPWGPEAKAVLRARLDRRAVALEVVEQGIATTDWWRSYTSATRT